MLKRKSVCVGEGGGRERETDRQRQERDREHRTKGYVSTRRMQRQYIWRERL